MLLLNKGDMQKVFGMKDAIEADKKAFCIFSEGGSEVPLRTNIRIPRYEGQTLFMPGYVERLDSIGIKVVSVFPRNREIGKPAVPATMALADGTTGEVIAIMDGTYLTQLRTGAASGVATELLARQDAKVGALIGAGGQAATQLEAMLAVRDLTEVRIFDADQDRARAFVETMAAGLAGLSAVLRPVASAADAVAGADIITTVTTSKKPVFDGRMIKAGAHINAVGSYMPEMQELDETIVMRAGKIFCESKAAALAEAGDIVIPLRKGKIGADHITGELGELIAGKVMGRESAEEITLFKSVGIAVVDIVTAHEIYQRAKALKVGVTFNF